MVSYNCTQSGFLLMQDQDRTCGSDKCKTRTGVRFRRGVEDARSYGWRVVLPAAWFEALQKQPC